MKILNQTAYSPARRARLAFTLVEIMVAIVIIMITFVTIFGTMTLSLSITQTSRENLRATQIMLDKMEGVRLYKYTQLTDGTLIAKFTNSFYETNNIGSATATGSGVQYTGVVSVTSCPFNISYSNYMQQVSVSVGWISGGTPRTRSMSTFVSLQGLQNYIYND
ncbi:MAG: hypothetical protein JWR19_3554 [Pedosphaera sp.]|jgi:type II secretory pathway pseudopilin PulG|nr:hypothetical protein [Pedosphaera sp.]